MLHQRLQQKLLQKLSPQQILLMKLLQIPSIALEQRIKQEIEENPALEELADTDDAMESEVDYDEPVDHDSESNDEDIEIEDVDTKNSDDEFDFDDYIGDDDEIPSYKLNSNNSSPDDERREIPFVSGTTFHDMLISQLGLRGLTEQQFEVAFTYHRKS